MNQLLYRLLGQGLGMPPDDPAPGAAPAAPASPAAPAASLAAAPAAAPPDTGKPASEGTPGISEKEMTALLDDSEHDDILPDAGTGTSEDPKPVVSAVPPVQQPAGAPASPPQVPPVQPPAAAPPVVSPAPVVPGQPVAAAPVVAPPTAPVTPPPAAPAPSPETVRAEQVARRTEYAKTLETLYAMPEKDALDFNANPGAALPKMAAKLHIEVLESAIHGIMMQLPQVVEGYMTKRENTARAENEFYSTWPMLDKANPQHKQTVNSLMHAIVAGNPNITRAEAIKQAGAASLVALGIPYDAPRIPVPGQPPAGAAVLPAAPPAATPFAPALPGVGGMGVPGAKPGGNPFEQLSREFDEEI